MCNALSQCLLSPVILFIKIKNIIVSSSRGSPAAEETDGMEKQEDLLKKGSREGLLERQQVL